MEFGFLVQGKGTMTTAHRPFLRAMNSKMVLVGESTVLTVCSTLGVHHLQSKQHFHPEIFSHNSPFKLKWIAHRYLIDAKFTLQSQQPVCVLLIIS